MDCSPKPLRRSLSTVELSVRNIRTGIVREGMRAS
jgi:hypothetical protein